MRTSYGDGVNGAAAEAPVLTTTYGSRRPRGGRRTRWRPQAITGADRAAIAEAIAAYGDAANAKTRERLIEDFTEFHRINHISVGEAFKPFVGQLRRCGLMWSTISTYVGYLRPLLPELRRAYHEVRRVVDLAHADESAMHSRSPIVLSESRNIAGVLEDVAMRAAVYLLTATGGRMADLRRLRRRQIKVGSKKLCVEFRVMKNRRRRGQRVVLRVPHTWSGPPTDSVLRYLAHGEPEQPLLGHLTATVVNKELLQACERLSYRRMTTYDFRKRFMQIAYEKSGNDATRAQRYTLHLSSKTVEAFYLEATN
jgi:integrase